MKRPHVNFTIKATKTYQHIFGFSSRENAIFYFMIGLHFDTCFIASAINFVVTMLFIFLISIINKCVKVKQYAWLSVYHSYFKCFVGIYTSTKIFIPAACSYFLKQYKYHMMTYIYIKM